MEAPYSLRSWGDPHIAERAEAILDKIAQRRLNPCPLEATNADTTSDQDESPTA